MRPTLLDIATEAGVSPATVDRVLNARPGVSPRTRAAVEAAARRIGYLLEVPGGARPLRLAAILPSGTNAFIADLADRLRAQAADMAGVTLDLHLLDALDPTKLAQRLDKLGDLDGITFIALNHPLVREAMRAATARGQPLVTLVSDIPDAPRLGYVGIDNGQAGRLAGQITGRFLGRRARRGMVAFFAGTLAYRGHQEREMGFRQILAEEFPGLRLLDIRESREDRTRARDETRAVLAAHPDLVAIYNAGGGTAGIAEALSEAGRAGDIVFVAHEATRENKALLLQGTLDAVIDQAPRVASREALAALVRAARSEPGSIVPPRLHLILRENMPED